MCVCVVADYWPSLHTFHPPPPSIATIQLASVGGGVTLPQNACISSGPVTQSRPYSSAATLKGAAVETHQPMTNILSFLVPVPLRAQKLAC